MHDINLSTKNSNKNNERENAIYNKARTAMIKVTKITEEVLLIIRYDMKSTIQNDTTL